MITIEIDSPNVCKLVPPILLIEKTNKPKITTKCQQFIAKSGTKFRYHKKGVSYNKTCSRFFFNAVTAPMGYVPPI